MVRSPLVFAVLTWRLSALVCVTDLHICRYHPALASR